MTSKEPEFGTVKISLLQPGRRHGKTKYTLVRRVFTDEGTTSLYDEAAKDFVSRRGSWRVIETMGEFDSPADAREFLLARKEGEQEL